VEQATRRIIEETRGFSHIVSTADGVLPGTPPENFIAFVQAARQ
jgi:uroporphyrinogen-III decarboxylase